MTTTPKPATERQRTLIETLKAERVIDTDTRTILDILEQRPNISTKAASSLITLLFTLPRIDGQDTTRRTFTPEAGMYRKGDELFRVKISKTGNWYAEVAVMPGEGRTRLDWKYLGKRVKLDDAERLTDAEAGKMVGYCVRCNAELTDPESIARGMGPICAGRE